MLVAIFALLIMSTVAVAALISADDERRSSRAVRSANASFYSTEAGLQEFWANEVDSAFVDSLYKNKAPAALAPGGTRDFGWRTLPNGGKYHVTLRRLDNGGQQIYQLTAEGRGARGLAGEQQVSFLMTPVQGSGMFTLGKCCSAAGTVRGDFKLANSSVVTGMDTPPPSWSAGRCAGIPTQNKPGIIMKDTTLITRDAGATIAGVPPIVQDATMDSTTFLQYGDLSHAQLLAMANHTIDATAGQIKFSIGPTTNPDGTCKTSDRYNWGSDNPAHPCYNYFPIIRVRGEMEVLSGYGQALVVMDRNNGLGAEFELEPESTSPPSVTFAGLVVGFGCVEFNNNSTVYGAVFADKYTQSTTCGSDRSLYIGKAGNGYLRWSSCAAQLVLDRTGVAAASGGIPIGGAMRIARGFQTRLR
ncbi:MAG: hypothetical protein ACREMV_15910 [Gemmatimonadales bacterium]